jgi:class 3 adenylate cyclase
MDHPAPLPSGTLTLLLTDIEGSTRLLQYLGDSYPAVLEEHHRLLREAVQQCGGHLVSTEGDSAFFVFPHAPSAVSAAVVAQRAVAAPRWPPKAEVRVRMGLRTGEPTLTASDYTGLDVHRASRVRDAAHGGQVLLSQTTRELVERKLPKGVGLSYLGAHSLKDLPWLEPVFQLLIEGLPTEFKPIRCVETRGPLLSLKGLAQRYLERDARYRGSSSDCVGPMRRVNDCACSTRNWNKKSMRSGVRTCPRCSGCSWWRC